MTDVRTEIGNVARWAAANEPRIHYSMGPARDDALSGPPMPLPLTTDCSGLATYCHKWGGAPDPNGFGYRVLGATGSMLANNPQIPVSACKVGDFIVYGYGSGDHVVVVIEPGSDPLVVSHGQEAGPIIMRHSSQVRYRGSRAYPRALDTRVPTTGKPPTPTPIPIPLPEDDVDIFYMLATEDTKDPNGKPDGVIVGGAVYVLTETLDFITIVPNEAWLLDYHSVMHDHVKAPTPGARFGTTTDKYWLGKGVGNVWRVPGEFLRPIVAGK